MRELDHRLIEITDWLAPDSDVDPGCFDSPVFIFRHTPGSIFKADMIYCQKGVIDDLFAEGPEETAGNGLHGQNG
jgi:hypothetical protein